MGMGQGRGLTPGAAGAAPRQGTVRVADARGALEERRRQPATLERQAREHGIRRERTAMRPGDHEQAVEQRVGATRGDTLRMRGRLPLTHLHNRLCTPHASTPIIGPGMRF